MGAGNRYESSIHHNNHISYFADSDSDTNTDAIPNTQPDPKQQP